MTREEASMRLQQLLLDNGAQIRSDLRITDDMIWAELVERAK